MTVNLPPTSPPSRSTDDEVFRILITTDNHIGYKENDNIRCNDALSSFEEVLQIAVPTNHIPLSIYIYMFIESVEY